MSEVMSSGLLHRLERWWIREWFETPRPYSLAICRVFLFLAVYWTYKDVVRPDYAAFLSERGGTSYVAKGVLLLFGDHPPPAAFFEGCALVAPWACLAAIVGFMTRLAMPLAVLSVMCLELITVGWLSDWCHGYVVIFLTACAFMFGRAGDVLSVDSFLAKRLGRKPKLVGSATYTPYSWPVLLGQYAVAFMFFSAGFFKLANDPLGLGWVFSDSLRNSLVLQYTAVGRSPSQLVFWLISREWGWKGMALGNMICQFGPMLSCFFLHRPILRALLGVCFVTELIGLGVVVDAWNPHWLPIGAFFVDWDALVRFMRRRFGATSPQGVDARTARAATPRLAWRRARIPTAIIFAFVGYNSLIGLTGLDRSLLTYPFSSYSMFSTIRAEAPYATHKADSFDLGRFDLQVEPPLPEAKSEAIRQGYFANGYRFAFSRRPAEIASILQDFKNHFAQDFAGHEFVALAAYQRRMTTPAHPAPPVALELYSVLQARLSADGSVTYVDATPIASAGTDGLILDVSVVGYGEPTLEFTNRADKDDPASAETALTARLIGPSRYELRPLLPSGANHVFIRVREAVRTNSVDTYLGTVVELARLPRDPVVTH